jgi:hypothetical protein
VSLLDLIPARRANSAGIMRGAAVALVTSNSDPQNEGRVKVKYPWLDDQAESPWARVVCFYAGPGRGGYIMPEVGDEVLVMFERGSVDLPYIVGSLWNGVDVIPGPGNPDGENNTKWFQSRSGHVLHFEDKDGAELIELKDKSGKLRFEIDVAKDLITMEATTGDIFFKAPAGPVNIECKTMEIQASNSSTIEVGNHLTEVSKDRNETIGSSCSATASALWQVGTKTLTVSFGSGKFGMAQGSMVVDQASVQTIGQSEIKSGVIHRNSGPETLIAGSLNIDAKGSRLEVITSGPATLITGMHTLKSDADGAIVSSNLLTVMGGLINYSGGSAINTLASLVTLC